MAYVYATDGSLATCYRAAPVGSGLASARTDMSTGRIRCHAARRSARSFLGIAC